MKKLIVYYKVVSYIIIVIAGLLSLLDLLVLLVGLSNPPLLISAFIIAAVIIYSFASFSFFTKNIEKNTKPKASVKDWIKINAYITAAFCILTLFQDIILIASPAKMAEIIKESNEMNSKMNIGSVPQKTIESLYKGVLYITTAYALLLLSHVIITLRLVKQYGHLFNKKDSAA